MLHLDGVRILNAIQTFELIQNGRVIKVKQFSVVPVGKLDKSKPGAVEDTPWLLVTVQ